jgi:hypothetical protein
MFLLPYLLLGWKQLLGKVQEALLLLLGGKVWLAAQQNIAEVHLVCKHRL